MFKGCLFAILFAVAGMIGFALIAPLLLPHANPEKLGKAAGPFLVVIGGACGFIYGWRRRRAKGFICRDLSGKADAAHEFPSEPESENPYRSPRS
jgi:hypothetical protein